MCVDPAPRAPPHHPPRQEHVLDDPEHALHPEPQRLGAHDGGVYEVEAQRVGAVRVQHVGRVGVVLKPFGHLLAVGREDEPVADEVLERGLVEERGGQDLAGARGWVGSGFSFVSIPLPPPFPLNFLPDYFVPSSISLSSLFLTFLVFLPAYLPLYTLFTYININKKAEEKLF